MVENLFENWKPETLGMKVWVEKKEKSKLWSHKMITSNSTLLFEIGLQNPIYTIMGRTLIIGCHVYMGQLKKLYRQALWYKHENFTV